MSLNSQFLKDPQRWKYIQEIGTLVKLRVFSGSSLSETDILNLQMQQIVFEKSTGFSFTNICFQISFSSKNLALNVLLNHFTKVSIVNFSSIEKSSDNVVVFLLY